MATAVDTNVIAEILLGLPKAEQAARALTLRAAVGSLVIPGIVHAELLSASSNADQLDSLLKEMHIEVDPVLDAKVVRRAASAWREYTRRRRSASGTYPCSQCGHQNAAFHCTQCGARLAGPKRVLPDFLIGAHAAINAAALLTWDRGLYGTYYPELLVIRPE